MLPDFPALFINFKTFGQATGQMAVHLAKKAEAAAAREKASIVLVVQASDLRLVSGAVKLPVFAQHIDPITPGEGTGLTLPEAVKQAGAVGTVLNHAENRRDDDFVRMAIERAGSLGLATLVCAEGLARAKQIARFERRPDLIAVEPPELIGGNKSISTAKPALISDAVKEVGRISPKIALIAGAGIKGRADVEKALELGAKGIFVASGIVKARNQTLAIKDLLRGFKS